VGWRVDLIVEVAWVPDVVSLLLAVVTTVGIVTLFLWPLVRAWGARRAAVARFIEAVEWGDFAGAELAAGRALDQGRDTF
jgi:hypothetical protein